jgi:protocatechuate 3,4-dioxygenase beta subunit
MGTAVSMDDRHPRRKVLMIGAGALAGLALPRLAVGQELAATPQCEGKAAATSAQTEGPFFKPKSPLQSDLRQSGLAGEMVTLTGFVLTRNCQPVANALVDLWHADLAGEYDNRGFRGRGHQFTDAQGRYRFVTIMPARYPGRTRHYHVKVQAANGPVLTTQLYFPGEAVNARNPLFRRELLLSVTGAGPERATRFDFVVARA